MGKCARSTLFKYKKIRPVRHVSYLLLSIIIMHSYLPFSSRTVAYWLFERGQELRLHKPVTLYLFLQKFVLGVINLKLQWPWFIIYNFQYSIRIWFKHNSKITCQTTSSLCILFFKENESFFDVDSTFSGTQNSDQL